MTIWNRNPETPGYCCLNWLAGNLRVWVRLVLAKQLEDGSAHSNRSKSIGRFPDTISKTRIAIIIRNHVLTCVITISFSFDLNCTCISSIFLCATSKSSQCCLTWSSASVSISWKKNRETKPINRFKKWGLFFECWVDRYGNGKLLFYLPEVHYFDRPNLQPENVRNPDSRPFLRLRLSSRQNSPGI